MTKQRVNIITLGCSKNTVDTQKLMRQLQAGGYEVVAESTYPADIVIINTCGFINDAREESVDTIIRHAEAIRKEGRGRLFVMGCLVEKFRNELMKSLPEVDGWFGVNKPAEIINKLGHQYHADLDGERILTDARHYAYLKVSEGCDRACAFCAIPDIRGRYTSVPVEKLVAEAEYLADQGVRELILIAQDITVYGLDLYRKQKLPLLVRKLSDIRDIKWIRLHYLHPSFFPYEIIDMMQSDRKLCRYIDLPIQHISDNVLRMMRREHDSRQTRDLLAVIRRKLPDAAIRTTIIAGHPGETEEDFRSLLSFIREFRFERLGAFRYSHEENTYAYRNYSDEIPEKTKEKRVARIMEVQQEISAELNAAFHGRIMKVIIDRKEGIFHIGRSQYDSPEVDQEILISSPKAILPGSFVDVRITGSTEFDLYAEVIENDKQQ